MLLSHLLAFTATQPALIAGPQPRLPPPRKVAATALKIMGTSSSSHPSSSAAALLSRRSASRAGSGGAEASGAGGARKTAGGRGSSYVRRAHHAGSWYDSSPSGLDRQLSGFLADAAAEGGGEDDDGGGGGPRRDGRPRAVVSPHAGYRYSGPTAAYAYLALREALSSSSGGGGGGGRGTTVVVLHPSHHVRLDGCAISGATTVETPISNLRVDADLRAELLGTGDFVTMDRHIDEAEHSGEMQYPFIAKAAADARAAGASKCRVLPIMVGALGTAAERRYGRILAPYLSRPDVFTVVSSDFCHWGRRFGYVPHGDGRGDGPLGGGRQNDIADYIEWLDRQGMDHIEMQRPGAFADYLRRYSNTICGRHPIGVWLNAMAANLGAGAEALDVRFVQYAQSGRVKNFNQSSVSYASAVARVAEV